MGNQMKPKHIKLFGPNPLTGCFGKAEAEQAAALLLIAMRSDDSWSARSPAQIAECLRLLAESSPDKGMIARWSSNPFFRPDIDRLIADGFAEWLGNETEGRKRPVRFTAEGLKALRLSRWNTCTVTVCSECLRASCWQGKLYCEDYVGAFCVEKTPWELKGLHTSQLEDPSYWDICDQCGTACGGRCDG